MSAERIEIEAGDWLAKRLSGCWTQADQAAFDVWYGDVSNRVAYVRLQVAWQETERLKALGAGVSSGVVPPRRSWGDVRFPGGTARAELARHEPPSTARDHLRRSAFPVVPRRTRWAAAAAGLFILAAGGGVFLRGRISGESYSTPIGGLEDVHLADGSRITLNTDSRIRVHLSKRERRIDLDRGEAFFEVAHDSTRPFVVYAGHDRVRAVGTKFSVRRDSDDVEVVVTEGKVQLATVDTPSGGRLPAVTILPAWTVAKTAKTAVLTHRESPTEAEASLSWRNGYLVFKDATLEDVARTFNRYNTRKIVIADPQIASIRIGGNFRSNNINAFLTLLRDGFPITVDDQGDKALLSAAH
jgi:transmembrane sensor